MSKNHGLFTYLLFALLFIGIIFFMMQSLSGGNDDTKYSDILALFDEQKVTEYSLDLGTG